MNKASKKSEKLEYKIVCGVGSISASTKGWNKEFNIVKWGENEPKIDIREWNDDHTRMGKGVTLTMEELRKIIEVFNKNEEDLDRYFGTVKPVERPKKEVVVVKSLKSMVK